MENFQSFLHFKHARTHFAPQDRRDALLRGAAAFREEFLSDTPVSVFRSFDLVRVPYPTRFAFREACSLPLPYIHILNRMFLVRFQTPAGLKTLLVSPSDLEGNRETPYFKRLLARYRGLGKLGESWLAPRIDTVEACLARAGVTPAQVDYITYDHLHTQDLRRWFGTDGQPGFFPNARLLVMRQEWESARALLPPQAEWYCPDGTAGVPADKVIELDDDIRLGPGVALVQTPGHTEGNHSIVVRVADGLRVMSENGVAADSYSPRASAIPGLRRYAHETGMEVVLNGNTMEGGLDQYLSMLQEKAIAGPSARNPEFCNVLPSSELVAYRLFPGIRPTFSCVEVEGGSPEAAGDGATHPPGNAAAAHV